eukprot:SAG11_NODE_272_length_11319_cov_9.730481_4_plen_104_part_00
MHRLGRLSAHLYPPTTPPRGSSGQASSKRLLTDCGGGKLSKDDVCRFQRDGVLSPVRGIPAAEAHVMLDRIRSFEAERGYSASEVIRNKGHLKLLWMYELVSV